MCAVLHQYRPVAANKEGGDGKGRYQPRNGSYGSLMAHSWTHWDPFINGRYRIRTCDLLGVNQAL